MGSKKADASRMIVDNYYEYLSNKKQRVLIPDKNPEKIVIKARSWLPAGSMRNKKELYIIDTNISEMNSSEIITHLNANKNGIALILIDIWEEFPEKDFNLKAQKVIKHKILPLIKLCRENNIPIIYASYDNRALSNSIQLEENELASNDIEEILAFLDKNNITSLVYGGFSTNYSLLLRSAGIVNLCLYYKYKVLIIRDATLAFEMPETAEHQMAKKAAISMIEHIGGFSTTLENLKKALLKDEI